MHVRPRAGRSIASRLFATLAPVTFVALIASAASCTDILLPAEPGDPATAPSRGGFAELLDTLDVDFGKVDCGTTAPDKVLVLTNRRANAISWNGSLLKGDDSPFSLSENNGPIGPGQTVRVVVRAKAIPAVAITNDNLFGDVLRITTDGPGLEGPFDVALNQTARGAVLKVVVDTLPFGKTREVVAKTLDIQNVGNVPAQVTVGVEAPFTVTPAGATEIAPGAKLTLEGKFSPAGGSFGNFRNGLRIEATGPLCNKLPQASFTVSYPDVPIAMCGGEGYTCALGQSGHVFCWGVNFYGQLGNGTEVDSLIYTQVANLADATSIACGYQHACAIRKDKTAVCWGGNGQKKQFEAQSIVGPGQLGNGTRVDSAVPVPVAGLTNVVSIAGGYGHTCALREQAGARTVHCWGQNVDGELGNGAPVLPLNPSNPPTPSLVPAPVIAIGSDVTHLSVSRAHACVVKADKTMWCWGENDNSELGNGAAPDSVSTPVRVDGLADATFPVTAGYHSCAVRTNGSVVCWGANTYGRLGLNDEVPPGTYAAHVVHPGIESPAAAGSVPVFGLTNPVSIAGGSGHSCALKQDKTVVCWGRNNQGMLGVGHFGNGKSDVEHGALVGVTAVPTVVKGLTNVRGLYVAYNHTCALTEANVPYCWGSDQSGELGDGKTQDSVVPVLVEGF